MKLTLLCVGHLFCVTICTYKQSPVPAVLVSLAPRLISSLHYWLQERVHSKFFVLWVPQYNYMCVSVCVTYATGFKVVDIIVYYCLLQSSLLCH